MGETFLCVFYNHISRKDNIHNVRECVHEVTVVMFPFYGLQIFNYRILSLVVFL